GLTRLPRLGGSDRTRNVQDAGSRGCQASIGKPTTPNYSLKARMLRIKQRNGLYFSTAFADLVAPHPHSPIRPVFHEIPRAAGPLEQRRCLVEDSAEELADERVVLFILEIGIVAEDVAVLEWGAERDGAPPPVRG